MLEQRNIDLYARKELRVENLASIHPAFVCCAYVSQALPNFLNDRIPAINTRILVAETTRRSRRIIGLVTGAPRSNREVKASVT